MKARKPALYLILLAALAWPAGCLPRPSMQQVTIAGKVMDLATQAPIAGATVTALIAERIVAISTTPGDGTFSFPNLVPGTYTLVASAQALGYADNTAAVQALLDDLDVSFALPPKDLAGIYCSLCGKVTDPAGAPVAGALIQADGGKQTNGVFTSKIADAQGNFFLYAVPTKDTEDKDIIKVTVMAIKEGYYTARRLVNLAADKTIAGLDLTLWPITEEQAPYADYDFETAFAWIPTGFWHRQANDPTIVNAAAPTYVNLPPLDQSGGAIPAAYSGTHCFWYGQAASGNYLGVQLPGDMPLSGGTSTAAYSGSLTSPSIDLTAAEKPVLTFMTWFEIEGENPNAEGYDLMTVEVSPDDGATFEAIGTLNPYCDPAVADRHHLAYTSGGFNQPANWIMIAVNLSKYVRRAIRLRFTFDTRDPLYNGFRGWFIDDVVVAEGVETDEGWQPIIRGTPAGPRR